MKNRNKAFSNKEDIFALMRIFKSAFVITFFSIIARVLGFVRDSLIAKYSGVGFMSDVFFASFKITNFFRKILAEGTFFAAWLCR